MIVSLCYILIIGTREILSLRLRFYSNFLVKKEDAGLLLILKFNTLYYSIKHRKILFKI